MRKKIYYDIAKDNAQKKFITILRKIIREKNYCDIAKGNAQKILLRYGKFY